MATMPPGYPAVQRKKKPDPVPGQIARGANAGMNALGRGTRAVMRGVGVNPPLPAPMGPAQQGRRLSRNSVLAPPTQRLGPSLSSMPAPPRTPSTGLGANPNYIVGIPSEAMGRDSRTGVPSPAPARPSGIPAAAQAVMRAAVPAGLRSAQNAGAQAVIRGTQLAGQAKGRFTDAAMQGVATGVPMAAQAMNAGRNAAARAVATGVPMAAQGVNAARDAAMQGVAAGVPLAAQGIAAARGMAADAGTVVGNAYGRAAKAYGDYVNPPAGPPIQRVSPPLALGPQVQTAPVGPMNEEDARQADLDAARQSLALAGRLPAASSSVPLPSSSSDSLLEQNAFQASGADALTNKISGMSMAGTPTPEQQDLMNRGAAASAFLQPGGGLQQRYEAQAGGNNTLYDSSDPAQMLMPAPRSPGVDEEALAKLKGKYQPNQRSRSIMSEGLGDGRDFDRMREADAAAEADFVMPTVGNVMNRDFRMMDPDLVERVQAGDARSRERRGTPEPGTAAADQLFRDQRQARKDNSMENRRVRQYRSLIGGGHGGPMGLNERTLRALQMVDGEDRRARGDFVQDRQFNESQRQFDENTAMQRARQRQQNRQQMGRLGLDQTMEENRAAEAEQTRRDSKKQQKFDNRLKKKEAKQTRKDIGKTEDIEDVELKTELEQAQAADAGVTQSYLAGGQRHSEQSIMEMNSLLSGDLPTETKKKFLRKYYGINNQKDLNIYLRNSGYEEDHGFSFLGSEDGTQGSMLNPLNWLNLYQSAETDSTRDNIQGRTPF